MRLGRKAIEVLKVVNKIYDDRPHKRKKYCKEINDFTRKCWADERSYRLLSYSDSVKILELYKQSNIKVAQEYLDREDETLFYEPLEYNETECAHSPFNCSNLACNTEV